MAGWIKLHRQVMDHWIWEDPIRFKWWMEIILLTNHTEKKTMIGGNLVTIKRGTFHTSELKLAERWGVSRNRVRRFLELLESDDMISTNKTVNGTTIKVHNYDVYQGNEEVKKQPTIQRTEQQTEQQAEQQTEHRTDIERYKTKNVKNDKELKNDKNVRSIVYDDTFQQVYQSYQENIEMNPSPMTNQKIQQDYESYGKEIMMHAIEKSALGGNHDYKFINWLLNDWKKRKFTTVEEIKLYEQQRQTKQTYGKTNPSYEKTPEWITNKNQQVQEVSEEEKQKLEEELKNFWKEQ